MITTEVKEGVCDYIPLIYIWLEFLISTLTLDIMILNHLPLLHCMNLGLTFSIWWPASKGGSTHVTSSDLSNGPLIRSQRRRQHIHLSQFIRELPLMNILQQVWQGFQFVVYDMKIIQIWQ